MCSIINGRYFAENISSADLVHESSHDSVLIKVFENKKYRWLQTGENTVHSAMNLSEPWQPVLPHYPAMLSVFLFKPKPDNILLMGLGGGELLRYLAHAKPAARLTAVEKSTAMIDVFKTCFNPDKIKPDIINADVCDWDANIERPQDIVFLDVYGDTSLPDCLYTENLYSKIYELLDKSGVLVANLAVKDEQEAVLLLTIIRKVFRQQTLFQTVDKHMNLIVLAFKEMPDPALLQEHAERFA